MQTPLQSKLELMRRPISQMRDHVTALTAVSLPHASIRSLLPMMAALRKQLLTFCSLPQPLSHSMGMQTTRHDLTLFITYFTKFLTNLVPQLDRLGARLNTSTAASNRAGAAEENMFWELWSCLAATCHALECASPVWPDMWAGEIQPLQQAWYAAFQALLMWTLPFTRSPAWLLMREQHGRECRTRDLLLILSQPINCLKSLSFAAAAPNHTVLTHVNALPTNFLPLLCCIVSEQFCNVPLLVPREEIAADACATSYTQALSPSHGFPMHVERRLSSIAAVCNNLAVVDSDTGSSGHFAFLTTPAVLQCLKGLLVLALQRQPPDAAHRAIIQKRAECLNLLLRRVCVFRRLAGPQPAMSEETREANRDATGLPLHLNPIVSRAALDTDVLVLHALSGHVEDCKGGEHAEDATAIAHATQLLVVQDWICVGRLYTAPAGCLAVMAKSVEGLAKQCSHLGLQLMVELQKQGHDQHSQGTSNLRQQAGLGTHAAAVVRSSHLAALNHPEDVQQLVFFTSHFRICTPNGLIPDSSELQADISRPSFI